MSAGGSGKRSSSGAISRRPIGVVASPANKMMAPRATARHTSDGRAIEMTRAATATMSNRTTGEPNSQKIFDAMKNKTRSFVRSSCHEPRGLSQSARLPNLNHQSGEAP